MRRSVEPERQDVVAGHAEFSTAFGRGLTTVGGWRLDSWRNHIRPGPVLSASSPGQ